MALLLSAMLVAASLTVGANAQSSGLVNLVNAGTCDLSLSPANSAACTLSGLQVPAGTRLPPGTASYVLFTNVASSTQLLCDGYAYSVQGPITATNAVKVGWVWGAAADAATAASCVQQLLTPGNSACTGMGVFFTLGLTPASTIATGDAGNVPQLNTVLVSSSRIQAANTRTVVVFTAQLSNVTTTNAFTVTNFRAQTGAALMTGPMSMWALLAAAVLALCLSGGGDRAWW